MEYGGVAGRVRRGSFSLLILVMPFGGVLSLIVLPLCSLPLQRGYDAPKERLDVRLRTPQTSDPIQTEGIGAAMEVLRIEAARLAELKAAADRDNGIEPMVVDGGAQPLPLFDTMEKVAAVLVRNATEEFGFAPRDVYRAVFNLPMIKEEHAARVKNLKYSQLTDLAEEFFNNRLFNELSHFVVAVQPLNFTSCLDRWTIDFKSPRIAREVVRSMLSLEHRELRTTYLRLRNVGPGLTGKVFEAIAHRMLCGDDAPQPIAMDSDGKTRSPTFSTPDIPQSTTTSSDGSTHSAFPTIPSYNRIKTEIYIDPLRNLREVTSDRDRYYVPPSATNPLFDSFTVTFGPGERDAVVSVFQITTSTEYGGSADGYLLIRKIIARTRKLLGCGQDANIRVKYILVCPEDNSQHRWKMPNGWNEKNSISNQIGNGFCMRIPS